MNQKPDSEGECTPAVESGANRDVGYMSIDVFLSLSEEIEINETIDIED